MPGALAPLLEVIANVHRRGLDLRHPMMNIHMGDIVLDVQTFGVGIENERAAIRVRNFRTFYLTT
jgi:hypothetical protein